MLVIVIEGDGGQVSSVNINGLDYHRLSYGERADWLEAVGFVNRIALHRPQGNHHALLIQRGSLVFGFRQNEQPYGFVFESDVEVRIPAADEDYVIVMRNNGSIDVELFRRSTLRGINHSVSLGIPWYTHNGNAVIGKVIRRFTLITGFVVCDDSYWCEWFPPWDVLQWRHGMF